ncbi:hypothetical protein [Mesorhizobium sp. 113-1-2]|uniref:hypothetical protein n=1 Tax=Mesorhizobium sp. 113-1-2 TaxID=2744515 RepID=UPI000BBB43F1|nr:hypothetical protein [Mesorhizobium sp. 113-1-2]
MNWFLLAITIGLVLSAPFQLYGGHLLGEEIEADPPKGNSVYSMLYSISTWAKYGALKRQADRGDCFAWWCLLSFGLQLVWCALVVLAMFSSPIWRKWLVG